MKIPIDKELIFFSDYLQKNDHVIFSAPFGDGKSYFLYEFQEKFSEDYVFISLYPVIKTVEVGAEVAEKASEIAAEAIEVGTEAGETAIHELGSARTIIVTPDMVVIKESSLKSLMQSNIEGTSHKVTDVKTNSVFDEIKGKAKIPVVNETANAAEGVEGTSAEKTGLTEDEKAKIINRGGGRYAL